MQEKKDLRKKIIARRDRLSEEEVLALSKKVAQNLFSLEAYRKARTIMYFLSFGREVHTPLMVRESLAQGKRVAVPKTYPKEKEMVAAEIFNLEDDLVPGKWGILEPAEEKLRPLPAEEIDLVVVPGVAFNKDGSRLGYGGGFYDRFIPRLAAGTVLVALAFELQVVREVPACEWDCRMGLLVTEERVINCGSGRDA